MFQPPSNHISSNSCAKVLQNLRHLNRTEVEQALRKAIKDDSFKLAIDTSFSPGRLPNMEFPNGCCGGHYSIVNPDKSNVVSPVMPMFLHLTDCRQDADGSIVLHKAINRVWHISSINQTLKTAVCFGTNGSKECIWMVIFKRAFDNSTRQLRQQLEVVRLSSLQVMISVWDHLNYAALRSPLFYVSPDWFPIMKILKAMSVHAGYCGIRLLQTGKIGSAKIYSISLPCMDYNNRDVCISLNDDKFVIKIQDDSARIQHEIDVLKDLKLRATDAWKYVVLTYEPRDQIEFFHPLETIKHLIPMAHFDRKMCPNMKHFIDLSKPTLPSMTTTYRKQLSFSSLNLYSIDQVWWNIQSPNSKLSVALLGEDVHMSDESIRQAEMEIIEKAHAIMMFKGLNLARAEYDGISLCLDEIHNAGYLHTDLRRFNLLKFMPRRIPNLQIERTSFVIDFDNASVMTTVDGKDKSALLHVGDRTKNSFIKRELRHYIDENQNIVWNVNLDRRMMIDALCQFKYLPPQVESLSPTSLAELEKHQDHISSSSMS
jgi:hypothetical protein